MNHLHLRMGVGQSAVLLDTLRLLLHGLLLLLGRGSLLLLGRGTLLIRRRVILRRGRLSSSATTAATTTGRFRVLALEKRKQ